jgi:hypothetical protein
MTLQQLLIILDGQKLVPGFLTPTQPTALGCVIDMMNQFNYYQVLTNPTAIGPAYTGGPQSLLLSPAWIGSLAAGQDAIFLDQVDGNLALNNTPKPAYIFSM